MEALKTKGQLGGRVYFRCRRRFRFGNQATLLSTKSVEFDVCPFGVPRRMKVWLVPGHTPMLCARTCTEGWGVIQNFRDGTFSLVDDPEQGWTKGERDEP